MLSNEASSLVVAPESEEKKTEERLKEIVATFQNRQERNSKTIQAYNAGYSQYMIASTVGLSQQAVGKVIIAEKL